MFLSLAVGACPFCAGESLSREGLCVWAWRDNPSKVAAYATEVDLGTVTTWAQPLEEGANGNR